MAGRECGSKDLKTERLAILTEASLVGLCSGWSLMSEQGWVPPELCFLTLILW